MDFDEWIVCPHCGEADHEMTEYPRSLEHDGDEAEHICGHCDKTMTVVISVSYEYGCRKE